MRKITSIAVAASLLMISANAAFAASNDPKTVPSGPYESPCKKNPKACGVGYDGLKNPHVPKSPETHPK